MSRRRPGGYIDREQLALAVDINEDLAQLIPDALRGLRAMPTSIALQFQRIGFELARQRAALAAMERIRDNAKAPHRKA